MATNSQFSSKRNYQAMPYLIDGTDYPTNEQLGNDLDTKNPTIEYQLNGAEILEKGVVQYINYTGAVGADGSAETVTLTIGMVQPFTQQSSNYTILTTDYCIECTAAVTIELPDPVGIVGQSFQIKNSSGGVVAIDGTIDGDPAVTLDPLEAITVRSNGTSYIAV